MGWKEKDGGKRRYVDYEIEGEEWMVKEDMLTIGKEGEGWREKEHILTMG